MLRASYVNICLGVIFIFSVFVNIGLANADIVWSDDFDDGDFDGWTVGLGEWAVINGTIQGQTPDTERPYCTLKRPSARGRGFLHR